MGMANKILVDMKKLLNPTNTFENIIHEEKFNKTKIKRILRQLQEYFIIIKIKKNSLKNEDFNCITSSDLNIYTSLFCKLFLMSIDKIVTCISKDRNETRVVFVNSILSPLFSYKKSILVIKRFGRQINHKYSHIDLLKKLEFVDLKSGQDTSGARGYYLVKKGAELNLSLINYSISYLKKQNFECIWCPYYIKKEIMLKVAQLEDFTDQLYKLKYHGNAFYLIATSEQSICSYFHKSTLDNSNLPIRLFSYSPCFRKEAGSHGVDTGGIFRVHQFDKIEQFVLGKIIYNIKDNIVLKLLNQTQCYYKSLKVPFQILSMPNNELNNISSQKFDLEGWFSGSKVYRELVSCSSCANHQVCL